MIILNKSISCKTLHTTLQEAYKNLARGFQGGDNLARRKKTCKKNFQNSCKFIHLAISCNILHILQDFMAILQDDFYWVVVILYYYYERAQYMQDMVFNLARYGI